MTKMFLDCVRLRLIDSVLQKACNKYLQTVAEITKICAFAGSTFQMAIRQASYQLRLSARNFPRLSLALRTQWGEAECPLLNWVKFSRWDIWRQSALRYEIIKHAGCPANILRDVVGISNCTGNFRDIHDTSRRHCVPINSAHYLCLHKYFPRHLS